MFPQSLLCSSFSTIFASLFFLLSSTLIHLPLNGEICSLRLVEGYYSSLLACLLCFLMYVGFYLVKHFHCFIMNFWSLFYWWEQKLESCKIGQESQCSHSSNVLFEACNARKEFRTWKLHVNMTDTETGNWTDNGWAKGNHHLHRPHTSSCHQLYKIHNLII